MAYNINLIFISIILHEIFLYVKFLANIWYYSGDTVVLNKKIVPIFYRKYSTFISICRQRFL